MNVAAGGSLDVLSAVLEEEQMGTYEHVIDTLEQELDHVEATFRGLEPEQWQLPTALEPPDPSRPPWTVFELAGHSTSRSG